VGFKNLGEKTEKKWGGIKAPPKTLDFNFPGPSKPQQKKKKEKTTQSKPKPNTPKPTGFYW